MIVEVYSIDGDGQMTARVFRTLYEIPDSEEGPPETLSRSDLREIRPAAIYRTSRVRTLLVRLVLRAPRTSLTSADKRTRDRAANQASRGGTPPASHGRGGRRRPTAGRGCCVAVVVGVLVAQSAENADMRDVIAERDALRDVALDMLSVTPEITDCDSKLEDLAAFLDAYDMARGVRGQTEMQDDLRMWAKKLRAALASTTSSGPQAAATET